MLSKKKSDTKKQLKKIPTYVIGLDDILKGGLPFARTTMLIGGPGSGKTVLSMEFLYRGALNGEAGIFFGFEEETDVLRENAGTMGWDIAKMEAQNKLFIMEGKIPHQTVVNGSFGLEPMLGIISGKAKEMGAKRIVIDALDVLFRLFDDPVKVRLQLFMLHNWIAKSGLTAVITLKPRQNGEESPFQEFFYSMSDCVIFLDARVVNQISTRRMRVVKYRGSAFERNEYPYVITDNGIRTIPISIFELKHKPFSGRIPSGVKELDGMLGGGYNRSSCILIAGEPGTGKTLLSASFVKTVCGNGERVIYLSLEESPDALIQNIKSAGINLDAYINTGLLKLIGAMPEVTGAEEHLLKMIDYVEKFKPQHMIIDAISACERMGGKQAAYEFLMRLMNYLKSEGITAVMTNQTTGAKSHIEISGNGISSMVDTVIFLSYQYGEKDIRRTISILKSRGSSHSKNINEYEITNTGFKIFTHKSSKGKNR